MIFRTTNKGSWVKGMLLRNKAGQTALEYTVLLIVIMGAFLGMQNYVKRGIQGRWRDAVDGLGDQYDPRTATTSLRHTLSSSTNTQIMALNTDGGYWTSRTDETYSSERKFGSTDAGAY